MKQFILPALLVSIILNKVSSQDADALSPLLRRTECGGSLKADSNSLSYPGVPEESLIPGETCVWTIHLETTRDFRINFSNFSVEASNSLCSDGAIRLYSLSNLVPPDRIEEYSFCSEKQPEDDFFLGGNVAVLVLHVDSSNTRPGTGFTINWEGNAFDQLGTRHITTFTSADRGSISYPGVGTYESSLAATWLISKEPGTSTQASDLQLSQLGLESCSNPDPCTCDALVIYEVRSSGTLKETTRFCSNSTSPVTLSALPNTFLLAFFSDFIAAPTGATGFSVLYYPSEISSEPTTPENGVETTTELETSSYPDEYCGQILTSDVDHIFYRGQFSYRPNERCVWVIAPRRAASISISVTYNPTKPQGDGLLISNVIRSEAQNLRNFYVNGTGSWEFNANILIITLFSDSFDEVEGFNLYYTVGEITSGRPAPTSEIIMSTNYWPNFDYISYPSGGGNYEDYALAAFIYTPQLSNPGDHYRYAIVSNVSLERNCCDCDSLYAFEFSSNAGQWVPHPNFQLCDESSDSDIVSKDMILLVFKSDSSIFGNGFEIQFSVSSDLLTSRSPRQEEEEYL